MSITEIVNNIPNLFMYFFPGYFFILIKNSYGIQIRKKELKEIFILSIAYSYLFYLLSFQILLWTNLSIPIQIVCMLLGIIIGIINVRFNWSKIFEKKFLKTDKKLFDSTWDHILDTSENVQARVYLDEQDICYMGEIRVFSYSNSGYKDICLHRYDSFKISTGEDIEITHESDDYKVYIDCSNVSRIELFEQVCL